MLICSVIIAPALLRRQPVLEEHQHIVSMSVHSVMQDSAYWMGSENSSNHF